MRFQHDAHTLLYWDSWPTPFMMDNLEIIGTSHIAEQSVKHIQKAFNLPVDIVAIELDPARLHALLHPNEAKASFMQLARRVGMRGALFAVIARWAQAKLGDKVGLSPGADMKVAYELAIENKSKIALIDRPLEITLRRFSKSVPLREKALMAWDVARGSLGFGEKVKIDLRSVPRRSLINKLLIEVKKRYPNTYSVLVAERDELMARKLQALRSAHPDARIVAVVGAGHVEGMKRHLKDLESSVSVSWSVSPHKI